MTFVVLPAIVCGIVGLFVGTFLPEIIKRTPMRQRMATPGVHCARCGVAVSSVGRVPWLARLTGKNACRQCDARLWNAFPGVEIATAAVFALVGGRTGWAWELPAFLVFAAAMLVITIVDARHHMIPNRVVYPTWFAALVLLAAAATIEGEFERLISGLIGMSAAWLFFAVVHFINPRGLGFGDVRLSGLIGLISGWVGLGNVLLGMLLGLLIGAMAGLVMVLARRGGMKDAIPFGPFLVIGGFLAIFFGESFSFIVGG